MVFLELRADVHNPIFSINKVFLELVLDQLIVSVIYLKYVSFLNIRVFDQVDVSVIFIADTVYIIANTLMRL